MMSRRAPPVRCFGVRAEGCRPSTCVGALSELALGLEHARRSVGRDQRLMEMIMGPIPCVHARAVGRRLFRQSNKRMGCGDDSAFPFDGCPFDGCPFDGCATAKVSTAVRMSAMSAVHTAVVRPVLLATPAAAGSGAGPFWPACSRVGCLGRVRRASRFPCSAH
jgi:hypothetical protein